MTDVLLVPPVAFAFYLALAGILSLVGRWLAGPERPNPTKRSLYTGGEALSRRVGVPGYRPFFVIALFFAVLHLGMLILGSGGLTPLSGLYLVGLLLALLALILG